MTDQGRHCSVSSLLRGWAERSSDAVALVAPGYRALTYGQLAAQMERHVHGLFNLGVGPEGIRVAIILPQGPEMITAFLTVAAGATSAPLNPNLDGSALEFCFVSFSQRC